MAISELLVQTALKELSDPNTGKDYMTTKSARNIRIDGNDVALDIVLGYPARSQIETAVSNWYRASKILLLSLPARVGWASRRRRSIWPWRWPPRVPR